MELFDVYDKDRNKTGITMARGEVLPEGCYRLVVHICIFNSKGEMLIQQRQPFKAGWPNKWDITVGGAAQAGESSNKAAERETLEEIGFKVNLENERPYLTVNFKDGFDDIYILKADVDIKRLKLQEEEVQNVAWASKEKIFSMMEDKVFIPYHKGVIEILFNFNEKEHMGLY